MLHRSRVAVRRSFLLAICVVMGAFWILSDTVALGADDAPVFDYVILVDVSGSMVGLPDGSGNAVIFPQVKQAVSTFVADLPDGSRLKLIPFSGPIDDGAIHDLTITSDADRREAIAYLDNLEATGQVTWLYNAIDRGLTELAAMREGDDSPHVQSLFIYTDALGNGPDDLALDTLLQRIDAARADQPNLYVKYVSLGVAVPNADALLARGVDVNQDPAGAVSPVYEVRVSPAQVALGALSPAGSARATIQLQSNASAVAGEPVWLSVAGGLPGGASLEPAPSRVAVGRQVSVEFRLADPGAALAPGSYQVDLRFESDNPNVLIAPRSVPLSFAIAAPTPTPTATPLPSPTPTPVPPTPVPTPTPVVALPAFIDLGAQSFNLDANPPLGDLSFATDVPVSLRGASARAQLAVASLNDSALAKDGSLAVFFGDAGDRPTTFDVDASHSVLPLRAVISADALRGEGDAGTFPITGSLQIRASSGAVTLDGKPVADGAQIPFHLVVQAYRPLDWRRLLLPALAAVCLVALLGALPRLPKDALLASDYDVADLRAEQRKRPLGFLLGGPVVLGAGRLGLGLESPLARVRGGWGWPKRAVLQTLDDGVVVNGEPPSPGTSRRLRPGDEIVLAGRAFRYGFAAADSAAEDSLPVASVRRRRIFRRRSSSMPDDFADLAAAGDGLGEGWS